MTYSQKQRVRRISMHRTVGSRSQGSKRGISTIVGALLMVVVVATASSLAVLWSTGALNSIADFWTGQSNRIQEAIAIEEVYFNRANATIRVYVRNIGSVSVTVTGVIISWSNQIRSPPILDPPTSGRSLGGGQFGTFRTCLTFTGPSTCNPVQPPPFPCPSALPAACGVTLLVKVITARGSSDTFQVFVP